MSRQAAPQSHDAVCVDPSGFADPPLSDDHVSALREACAPVGLLNIPAPEVVRTLRRHGYVEIVLGGIQITPDGLERLLRERQRKKERAIP